MTSKADLLAATDLTTEIVRLPDMGIDVPIRMLSAPQMLDMWEAVRDDAGGIVPGRVRRELLARSIVGDDGKPVFVGNEIDDFLANKSTDAVSAMFQTAQRVNGMLGGTEKNLPAATSGALPSDSA
jgi:hypothetical protein